MKKEFFWKDKSGRGFSNTFNLQELKSAMKGERSYNDESAYTWAKDADVADEWENETHKITRTK